MGWDWVEDVCFPLFHCFFEMCAIPKSLLKINFFYFTGIIIMNHDGMPTYPNWYIFD